MFVGECRSPLSPGYLRTADAVLDVVSHFSEEGRPVATLRHGPRILDAAGVLEGWEVSSSPVVRAGGGSGGP